jgi:hypothetical protein
MNQSPQTTVRLQNDHRLAMTLMSLRENDAGKALIEWVAERWAEETIATSTQEGTALYRSQGRASAFQEFLNKLEDAPSTAGMCRRALAKRRQL